jgi:ribulose-5-phosphate 4-epimerase/fuculose-1-phosphate aldolase
MTTVLSSASAAESKAREEIVRIGVDLYSRHYTVGTAGNISARLEDGWLITPTDACLGHLEAGAIAKVSSDGQWLSGDKPSKTLVLHRSIYDQNPNVGGVVHTHSTNLVALTLAGVWSEENVLPPITPYQVMKVGKVPFLSYRRPGHSSVADRVRELANDVRAVLLDRLGPVVWGATVSQAAWSLEELEETAKLWLMLNPKPTAMTEEQIEELRVTFGARW